MNNHSAAKGVSLGLLAYGLWGFFPLYIYLLKDINVFEVLAQRILWSLLFLTLLVVVSRQINQVKRIFSQKKLIHGLAASALFIAINWGTFIWAVGNGQAMYCSLGYFISPLVSMALGRLFLGEKLSKLKWMAVALVLASVAYQVVIIGYLPIVSTVLAFSFSIYGLIRKKLDVPSNSGLWVETVILVPFAAIFLVFDYSYSATLPGTYHWLLFAGAGLLTAVPLLFFNGAAKRLQLSTIGLMMYINPTIQLFCAVVWLSEEFTKADLISFSLVWLALFVYTLEQMRQWHKQTSRLLLDISSRRVIE